MKKKFSYNIQDHTNRQSDKGFFIDLCKVAYNMNVSTTKGIRLGRRNANNEQPQHRPLLVALEYESDKATLIAHSSQLRQHDKIIWKFYIVYLINCTPGTLCFQEQLWIKVPHKGHDDRLYSGPLNGHPLNGRFPLYIGHLLEPPLLVYIKNPRIVDTLSQTKYNSPVHRAQCKLTSQNGHAWLPSATVQTHFSYTSNSNI